jgi:hypothetical protein
MVDGSLRHVQPLIRSVVLGAITALGLACQPSGNAVEAATRLGFDPAALVDIGSAALAPSVEPEGRVSIVAIHARDGEWVASPLSSWPGPAGNDSVHLMSYDGETGEEWNTFVVGTAQPGTVRVELSGHPDQRGGMVAGGAWLIALRDKDVRPGDVAWRFIAGDGHVRTGVGIFPPDA